MRKIQGGAIIRAFNKSAFSCQQVATGWILITALCLCVCVYVFACVCGVTRDPLILTTPLLFMQAPVSCSLLDQGKHQGQLKGAPYRAAQQRQTPSPARCLSICFCAACMCNQSGKSPCVNAGVYARGGWGHFVWCRLYAMNVCVDRKWLSALQM